LLILKSGSPRRIQIFQDLGLVFQIQPSSVDESILPNEHYMAYLRRITEAKLDKMNATYSDTCVASDTIVVLDDKIFPKPLNFENARNTLEALNGKVHSVYSSFGIFKHGEYFFDFDTTLVEFKNWSIGEIENYIEKFTPFDKAGSYGVQDIEGPVLKFQGSYTNVLGFPLRAFYKYSLLWLEYLN